MFKRAHISAVMALIAGTLGFLGFIETPIAQTFFYVFMAFATVSVLLGMFEVEPRSRKTRFQPRRITESS